MNRPFLPPTAFVDPRGGNRREIESLMDRAASLLLPYLTEAAKRISRGFETNETGRALS